MKKAQVGVLMDCGSVWTKTKQAAAAMEQTGVGCELNVLIAHRSPQGVGQVGLAGPANAGGLTIDLPRQAIDRLQPTCSMGAKPCRQNRIQGGFISGQLEGLVDRDSFRDEQLTIQISTCRLADLEF